MSRIIIHTWLVWLLAVIPCAGQSTRDYPEPCDPTVAFLGISPKVFIAEHAELWMVVHPGAGGVRYDAYSISISKTDELTSMVHYIKLDRINVPDGKYKEESHLIAELPTGVAKDIGHLWETVLRQTRYQEPKGANGIIEVMLHGDSCYFGYNFRYFGQVNFLSAGGALLIQQVGFELVKYVQTPSNQRPESLKRIKTLLAKLDTLKPTLIR
jgi:hypothetical protein